MTDTRAHTRTITRDTIARHLDREGIIYAFRTTAQQRDALNGPGLDAVLDGYVARGAIDPREHIDADLPAAMRAAGLTAADLEATNTSGGTVLSPTDVWPGARPDTTLAGAILRDVADAYALAVRVAVVAAGVDPYEG